MVTITGNECMGYGVTVEGHPVRLGPGRPVWVSRKYENAVKVKREAEWNLKIGISAEVIADYLIGCL